MGLQGIDYKLDIAFVIDATGSMEPIMSQVRNQALTLGDLIVSSMQAAGKPVKELRMRLIDFADYATEGEDALHQTEFFAFPDDKQKFVDAVNAIEYEGRGGDIPENGLEALYAAMNSEWVKIGSGEKGRHVIVVMTDAVPLKLHERSGTMAYPDDELPPNVEELQGIWDAAGTQDSTTKLSASGRRLLLFVPAGSDSEGRTWDEVGCWKQTVMSPVDPAKGLQDAPLDKIVEEIVRSV